MLRVFRRLLRISEAEAHAALDKMEDPIRMSEQAIRGLRGQLKDAMQGLAEVKAIAIRTRREEKQHEEKAADYDQKAMLLLQKGQRAELAPAEVDRLATEALDRKEEALQDAARVRQDREKYEQMTVTLEGKVREIKAQMEQWENELRTLRARSRVSSATRKLNEQMANVDTGSTIAILERMREKVAQEEALAESYGEIAATPATIDDEIDAALKGEGRRTSSESLAEMKSRMGITGGG